MNYGLQISASGALASIHQQDALTNNLANVNTAGFKPIFTGTMQRLAKRQEDNLPHMSSNSMLERLGGGVFAAQTRIDFAQGTLEVTDNDLDMAIQGDGFFVIGDPSNPSLTRDGRFTINTDGDLVMVTNGKPVLDTSNKPIRLDQSQGKILVGNDGTITQRGAPVAQIQVSDVPDRSILTKLGSGLFGSQTGSVLTLLEASGTINQGMLEGSGVSSIDALMQIQSASKAAKGNIGMIDMQNRLMEKAINTFGRIG
ncbi:MAG: flagellar hook basal-body protein [Phycisphaerales bacterium]|nr:flagellar hook basal-body protein [Phycisphaerales bacterium]